jgi:hypothetical protein
VRGRGGGVCAGGGGGSLRRRESPSPARPHPESSSKARVLTNHSTSAKGSAGSPRQHSANLTTTREEGHTEVPTPKESLSCSNVSTAPPTGSSTTGDAVNRISATPPPVQQAKQREIKRFAWGTVGWR